MSTSLAICHLWWESTDDQWFPFTMGQYCGKHFQSLDIIMGFNKIFVNISVAPFTNMV